MLSFAGTPITFREYIDTALESRGSVFSEIYPFLNFGLYGAQLARWLLHFPRDRIHVALYDDFERDPATFLRTIFRFLGVDAAYTPDFSRRFTRPASHCRWNWKTGNASLSGIAAMCIGCLAFWARTSLAGSILYPIANPLPVRFKCKTRAPFRAGRCT
jgi:hypothetical protein